MVWVFSRAGEFLDVTVLNCVHYRVETSFPKAMDALKKRKSSVTLQKPLSVHDNKSCIY